MIPDLKLQAAEKEKLEGSRISDEQHSIEVDELNQRIDQLEAINKKLKLELDERSRQQLKAKEMLAALKAAEATVEAAKADRDKADQARKKLEAELQKRWVAG